MRPAMHRARWLGLGLVLVGLAALAGGAAARWAPRSPVLFTVPGSYKTIAVDAARGHAFLVNDTETAVSVLDTQTRRVLRTVEVGADIDAIAVDAQRGRVFVPTRFGGPVTVGGQALGMISVLDAASGLAVGAVPAGPDPDVLAVDDVTGQLAVVGGDGAVSLLDERSGAVRNTMEVGPGLGAVAVDGRTQHLVAVGASGAVSVVALPGGALLQATAVGQNPDQVAVDASRSRAFVTDGTANRVSMLDTQTGRLLRQVGVAPNPSAVAVDERRGRVFVASQGALDEDSNPLGAGILTVLDARSGRVVGTLEAGIMPCAVAVDQRTGHVFVVDAGGQVAGHDALAWLPSQVRRWLPAFAQPTPRVVPGSVTALDPSRA